MMDAEPHLNTHHHLQTISHQELIIKGELGQALIELPPTAQQLIHKLGGRQGQVCVPPTPPILNMHSMAFRNLKYADVARLIFPIPFPASNCTHLFSPTTDCIDKMP